MPPGVAEAATIAGLLRDYGPWGMLALSLIVNAWLLKGWMGCFEKRIADAKAVTEETTRCITNSSQHIATAAAAVAGLTATADQRLRTTETLVLEVQAVKSELKDLNRGRR